MIVLFRALMSVSWVIAQVFSRNLYKYVACWKTVDHLTLFIIYCLLQGDESTMPQEQNDDAIQNKARKRPHVWRFEPLSWDMWLYIQYVTVKICLGKDLSSISTQPTSEMQGCSNTLHLVKTGFVFLNCQIIFNCSLSSNNVLSPSPGLLQSAQAWHSYLSYVVNKMFVLQDFNVRCSKNTRRCILINQSIIFYLIEGSIASTGVSKALFDNQKRKQKKKKV